MDENDADALLKRAKLEDPVENVSTPRLVEAVRSVLLAGRLLPPDHPAATDNARDVFFEMLAELTRRGIDAESLVRYGLQSEVLSPLVAMFAIRLGVDANAAMPAVLTPDVLDGWQKVLGWPTAPVGSPTEAIVAALRSSFPTLLAWAVNGDLEDLFDLRPPNSDWINDFVGWDALDAQLIEDYSWLVDRFGGLGVDTWRLSSLHREHRWTDGLEPSPCPSVLMDESRVNRADLDKEIARRAVASPGGKGDGPWTNLALRMQEQATRCLKEGHYAEAATLFEFAVQQQPGDADALNNLGFCQIPTDPSVAVFNLERADKLGYSSKAINFHNRIIGHRQLSQDNIARNLAEEYWCTARQDDTWPVNAILWNAGDDGSLRLISHLDARLAIAEIAYELTTSDQEMTLWARRRDELG
jgi:hypothetical protein